MCGAVLRRWLKNNGRRKHGHSSVVYKLMSCWSSVLSLFAFFYLVIAIFAVFAMQLFGGKYDDFDDGKPRSNFDTFPTAWLTIFQVTSGDQWMVIMWEAMRLQWVSFPLHPITQAFTNPAGRRGEEGDSGCHMSARWKSIGIVMVIHLVATSNVDDRVQLMSIDLASIR